MATLKSVVKSYPVLAFYVLVFIISWGGVLLVIGRSGGIPGPTEQVEQLWPIAMLIWFAGPSLSGLLMTAIVSGKAGLRELFSRLRRWRVDARWYGVALFTGPFLYLTTVLVLSLFSPAFVPAIVTTDNRALLLIMGIVSGLIGGGFLEELGWTGFAVPQIRRRYGVFATGLIVGILWGAVHFSVIFWMSGSTIGELPLGLFFTVRGLELLAGGLVAFRVLMVWVYERTNGNLLIAMLMHASLSAAMLIFGPEALSGMSFLVYILVGAAFAWTLVAAVAVVNHGHFSQTSVQSSDLGTASLVRSN